METYVLRLTHEKYAATYNKVVNSLKNMGQANPASPTLVNFLALIKGVDADAAKKLSAEVHMPVAGVTERGWPPPRKWRKSAAPALECADMSALCFDATYRVGQ